MKAFYLRLVGETDHWRHQFIEDDTMTMEKFQKKILALKEIVLSCDGVEDIPGGHMLVEKLRLVPTDKILSFHEGDHSAFTRQIAQARECAQRRQTAVQTIAKLRGGAALRFRIFWKWHYGWLGRYSQDSLGDLYLNELIKIQNKLEEIKR